MYVVNALADCVTLSDADAHFDSVLSCVELERITGSDVSESVVCLIIRKPMDTRKC